MRLQKGYIYEGSTEVVYVSAAWVRMSEDFDKVGSELTE